MAYLRYVTKRFIYAVDIQLAHKGYVYYYSKQVIEICFDRPNHKNLCVDTYGISKLYHCPNYIHGNP